MEDKTRIRPILEVWVWPEVNKCSQNGSNIWWMGQNTFLGRIAMGGNHVGNIQLPSHHSFSFLILSISSSVKSFLILKCWKVILEQNFMSVWLKNNKLRTKSTEDSTHKITFLISSGDFPRICSATVMQA